MAQACYVWRAGVKGYRYSESSPHKYLIQLIHDY
jgi:hypothetical protein